MSNGLLVNQFTAGSRRLNDCVHVFKRCGRLVRSSVNSSKGETEKDWKGRREEGGFVFVRYLMLNGIRYQAKCRPSLKLKNA